jgi:DNA-binding NarL/FixJ family response regulator
MEPRENSNPDQLILLIVSDSQASADGLVQILNTPPNEYSIKKADNFVEMKTKIENNKVGMVLFAIINNKDWFDKLIALDNEVRYKETKMLIYTSFTDASTIKQLRGFKNLRIMGIIPSSATRNEIIDTVTKIHNGDECFPIPEEKNVGEKILGKFNRNIDGTYKMPENTKDILNYQQQGLSMKQIKDINGVPVGTLRGRIETMRLVSKTHSKKADIKWAIEQGYIRKLDKK